MVSKALIYIFFNMCYSLLVWAPPSLAQDKLPSLTPGTSSLGVSEAAASTQPINTFPAPVSASRLDCLIEPNMMVDLATGVSGVVKVVNVDRGDIIKAGQILAQLEAEVERANMAHSSARVEFSSKKYRRMQELYKEQMVSAQQMEEAKTENDLAVAELRKATEMLNQRTVFSPFHGVVVERYVSPGELVEGKKVIKVAQINPLRVEVIVPITLLGEFKMGARMLVMPEGPMGGPFDATVQLVDRVVDAPSGTFRVRLALPNPNHKIAAGVRCKAQFAPMAMKEKETPPKNATAKIEKPLAPTLTAPSKKPQVKTPKPTSSRAITTKASSSTKPVNVEPKADVSKALGLDSSGKVMTETPQMDTEKSGSAPTAAPPTSPAIRETIPSGYGPDT